ncbi:MAG: CsgG/HfaB family protein [Pseudomonadota bacterium]
MKTSLKCIFSACSLMLATACATPGIQPTMEMSDATINPETVTGHALRWIPAPQASVSVAVYGIADETGAFKPSEGGQTLSRALTQAPTPLLIKALHDAGNRRWFSVIERENLNNLIKERQIIQEMRQRYLGETSVNQQALPALKFAGILIEGAITGYDTNTRTGGAGARYLGVGGSTQYREDSVSVYLRAVSVKTGEVLLSINSEQRVASVALQGDVFRFVSFQKLLEAEAGLTMNQPRHLAVRQALEKAVYGLIVEGAEIGLWGFENPEAGVAAIDHYRENYAPVSLDDKDGDLPEIFYEAHRRYMERRRTAYVPPQPQRPRQPVIVQSQRAAPAPMPTPAPAPAPVTAAPAKLAATTTRAPLPQQPQVAAPAKPAPVEPVKVAKVSAPQPVEPPKVEVKAAPVETQKVAELAGGPEAQEETAKPDPIKVAEVRPIVNQSDLARQRAIARALRVAGISEASEESENITLSNASVTAGPQLIDSNEEESVAPVEIAAIAEETLVRPQKTASANTTTDLGTRVVLDQLKGATGAILGSVNPNLMATTTGGQ